MDQRRPAGARPLSPPAGLARARRRHTRAPRGWLTYVIDELLKHQQASGAIAEEIGTANGYYPPPASNAAFGTNEAPIIQANGDPATDLLYTTNFAFKGLIEAAALLDDLELTQAVDRLADFMVRVQVRSDRPLLDGQWLRGFDYKKWDYWGSDSDHGWGVWGNQTGWTQAEIISGLALLEIKTSLWDLSADRRKAEVLSEVLDDMMANASPAELTVSHAAIKRSVTLKHDADTRYAAAGPATLTDGIVSAPSHRSGKWLGFEGRDLHATFDLEKVIEIDSVGLGCLQETAVGIYLPPEIKVSISVDGEDFTTVASIKRNKQANAGPERVLLFASSLNTKARYLRIHAKSFGTIPQGQSGQGAQAWLFVDELLVNAEEPEPKQE